MISRNVQNNKKTWQIKLLKHNRWWYMLAIDCLNVDLYILLLWKKNNCWTKIVLCAHHYNVFILDSHLDFSSHKDWLLSLFVLFSWQKKKTLYLSYSRSKERGTYLIDFFFLLPMNIFIDNKNFNTEKFCQLLTVVWWNYG